MNVGFPLCREPRHEEAVRRVIAHCVGFVTQRLPERKLVAIVLTGSFARGEGSVLPVDGRLRVLGDIEFLVVLPTETDCRLLRPRFVEWGKEAGRALGAGHVCVDIEFGPVDVDYFRRSARPSIFVYDLLQHGKVVWGRPDILGEIPRFGPDQVPREDALYLLFNRTIEQLDAYDRITSLEGDALLDVAYQRSKLLLDLAGSALAFARSHVAVYQRRPAAFARLVAETPSLAALLPPAFEEELVRAAATKLAPQAAPWPTDLSLEARRAWLRRQIVAAVPVTAALLRWELEQILGFTADLPGLLSRYLVTPIFRRRVWDWAKAALHPLSPPLPLGVLRSARLFWRTTPRALLYTAGALAYLNFLEPRTDLQTINRLLPLRRRAMPRDAEAQRRAIVALWRWCVRND